MITERDLVAAAEEHLDRTALFGPKPIDRVLFALGIEDPDEVRAVGQALCGLRKPRNGGVYAGGFLDGFVIGVRAARVAAERGDG